jgi:hypothetical protein
MAADLLFTWAAVLVGCLLAGVLGFVVNASKPER